MSDETCWYMTYVDDSDELIPVYATVTMHCSDCGDKVNFEGINAYDDIEFNYCPNCGRYIQGVRLVDSDGQVAREYPRKEQK